MTAYKQPRYNPEKTAELVNLRKEIEPILSQEDVAKFFGLKSYGTVGEWELGYRKPPERRHRSALIVYLADKRRVSYEDLVGLWKGLMEGEWKWAALTTEEIRGYYPTRFELQDTSASNKREASTPPMQRLETVRHFTSREKELKQLVKAIKPGTIVTLCGPGGIGKTALAAEAIRKLFPDNAPSELFPDGAIVYNFYEDQYARNALTHIARSFNVQVEPGISPNAAARRALSGKQALLILEGAENADDLEVVLAERNQCGVLITTRKREQAMLGRFQIDLKPFKTDKGVELLEKWAHEQIADEKTAEEICNLVGGLPLAVRLAGSYMAWRNEDSASYLGWLEKTPLEALDHGQRRLKSVPILLEKSVNQLGSNSIRLLQVVGLLAPTIFDERVIAEALFASSIEIRRPLDELVNYSLLNPEQNGYRVSHTLVHTYAREYMEAPANIVRHLAMHYTILVEEKVESGIEGYAWLDNERPHLMALINVCRDQKDWDATLFLVGIIDSYLDVQGHWAERVTALNAGLAAARAVEDQHTEGNFLGNLGNVYRDLGQVKLAIDHFRKALVIAQKIGDKRGESNRLGNLGNAYRDLGQVEKAIEHYEQALTIAQEIGDRRSQRLALGHIGNSFHDLGRAKHAIEYYEQALTISQEIGDKRGEGNVLGSLGNAYRDLGEVEKAIELYSRGLTIARELGDRQGESSRLSNLGNAYYDLGQVEQAIEYYGQALTISREIGDRRGESADLGNLGVVYFSLKQIEQAAACYDQALTIAQEIGDRRGEGNQLGNLGNVYEDLGQLEQAIECYNQALAIAQEIGDRQGEGNRLGNLGTAYYTRGFLSYNSGDLEQAIEYYAEALDIAREIGDRQGEGNRLANLGNLYSEWGQKNQAIEYYQQALAIFEEIKSPLFNQVRDWLKKLKDIE